MKAEPGTYRLFGKWIESGTVWKWDVVLLGVGPGASAEAERASEPSLQTPKPSFTSPDDKTKEKLRELADALGDVLNGRRNSPQLIDGALKLHDALFRGKKRRRRSSKGLA